MWGLTVLMEDFTIGNNKPIWDGQNNFPFELRKCFHGKEIANFSEEYHCQLYYWIKRGLNSLKIIN